MNARAGGAWRSLEGAKIWINGAWRDFGEGGSGTAIWASDDWNRIGKVVAVRGDFSFNDDSKPNNGPKNRRVDLRTGSGCSLTNMEHTWSNIRNANVAVVDFLYPQEIFGRTVTLEATTYFATQVSSDEQIVLTMIDYPQFAWSYETGVSFVEVSALARAQTMKISIAKEPVRQVSIDVSPLFALPPTSPKQLTLYCTYVSPNSLTGTYHGGGLLPCSVFVDGARYI